MRRKILVIMNPKSGKGSAKSSLFTICNRFTALEDEVRVCISQHKKHAQQVVEELAESYDILVCIGGDGTWNEVVNGLMSVKHKPNLCYLPSGTVNDFAATLKLPHNAEKMMNRVEENSLFSCDIGKFNNHYFTYVAAFGIFTEISYSTPQGSKNTFGKVAYFLEGIKQLTRIPRYHIIMESKEIRIEDDFIFGSITNSRYLGGFTSINSKEAQLDDGLFEVLFIRVPNNPLDVQNIISALLKREVNETWMYFLKSSHITITSEEAIPWTLDGEDGGSTTTASIVNKNKAITIMI